MNEEKELRIKTLDMALGHYKVFASGLPGDDVVLATAQNFLDFVNGESSVNEDSKFIECPDGKYIYRKMKFYRAV